METNARETILEYVRSTPGASTRMAAQAAGVDDSTADYHLRRLLKADLVRCHGQGRQSTWWHRDAGPFCPVLMEAIPAFRREEISAIARALDRAPSTTGMVAERAGVTMPQVRWNVAALERMRLVQRNRWGHLLLARGASTCIELAMRGQPCGRWGRCYPSRAAEPASARFPLSAAPRPQPVARRAQEGMEAGA